MIFRSCFCHCLVLGSYFQPLSLSFLFSVTELKLGSTHKVPEGGEQVRYHDVLLTVLCRRKELILIVIIFEENI
jgi:hypothetical protein